MLCNYHYSFPLILTYELNSDVPRSIVTSNSHVQNISDFCVVFVHILLLVMQIIIFLNIFMLRIVMSENLTAFSSDPYLDSLLLATS